MFLLVLVGCVVGVALVSTRMTPYSVYFGLVSAMVNGTVKAVSYSRFGTPENVRRCF
jgi:hypothetical protein